MSIRQTICSMVIFLFVAVETAWPSSLTPSALMAQGDSCRFSLKFNESLKYYQQAYDDLTDKGDPALGLQLLERIMRTHDMLRHWKEMPEASYRLYMLARQQDDSVYLSKALFMRGRRLYRQGHKQMAYQTCFHALGIMKRSNYEHKYHELPAFYSLLCFMYYGDGLCRTAMRMCDNEEYCVRKGSQFHNKAWQQRAWQRAQTMRIALLAKLGRTAEADKIYQENVGEALSDPLVGDALLEYYRLRHMNDEALRYLDRSIQHIMSDGDSLGRNMLKLLADKGSIYNQMGDSQHAVECFASTTRIADAISAHTLATISDEVMKVIDNERANSRHGQLIIVMGAAALLLFIVMLLMLNYSLMVRRKNQTIMATVRQLMHYRDMVVGDQTTDETVENRSTDAPDEVERHFKEIDRRIIRERLFVKPDFGRDDLMGLMGVDKNMLATIINKYTDTNVPGYINTKRMEYAVTLIKSHPEYTMAAIGEACGIPSATTFIRNFKNVYGMTPSDFRRQLEGSESTPPKINT